MWAWNKRHILVVASVLGGLVIAPTMLALSPLTEGYTYETDKPSIGSIVSLKKDTADTVEVANSQNIESIFGVVVTGDSSLLSISNGGEKEVQVATSGTVPVMASDINGEIKRGDHITASPIPGVGMKATSNVRVIGIAQGELDRIQSQTVKDRDGQEKQVQLGQVPLLVGVAYFFQEPEKTIVPAAIQNVANAFAGREVSTLPILISAAIFIITLIVVVSIIYSMIRHSIISVGRNPMSQSAIYRGLVQMSALVIAILAVSLVIIYFVLTRL